MKQFARCSNCRQWYLSHAVTTVDILRGNGLHRTALWCQPCIHEAERRSLYADDPPSHQEIQPSAILLPQHEQTLEDATGVFADLLEEHLELMEDAIQEEDETIAARISDFVARCLAYCDQLDDPEQTKRLTNHMNYWQTFLKMLDQSNQTN